MRVGKVLIHLEVGLAACSMSEETEQQVWSTDAFLLSLRGECRWWGDKALSKAPKRATRVDWRSRRQRATLMASIHTYTHTYKINLHWSLSWKPVTPHTRVLLFFFLHYLLQSFKEKKLEEWKLHVPQECLHKMSSVALLQLPLGKEVLSLLGCKFNISRADVAHLPWLIVALTHIHASSCTHKNGQNCLNTSCF